MQTLPQTFAVTFEVAGQVNGVLLPAALPSIYNQRFKWVILYGGFNCLNKTCQTADPIPSIRFKCSFRVSQKYQNQEKQSDFSAKIIEYRSTFIITNQQIETAGNTAAGICELDRYRGISAISRSKRTAMKNMGFPISSCINKNSRPIIFRESCGLSEAA